MAPSQGVNVLRRNGSQVRPDTPPTDSDTEPELEDVVKPRTVPVGSHFTARAIAVGSLIGILNAFSNTYFGLQTGWISGMAMPSALIGFASFRAVAPYLNLPFSPVENVLVQSVAGAVGTMPLGCGFVGVVPALEFLLKPSETLDGSSGYRLSLPRLLVWALGICFFGVVFGVPLRKELVIREKLKFPSGKATALMIGVLHGVDDTDLVDAKDTTVRKRHVRKSSHATDEQATLLAQPVQSSRAQDGEANAPSDMVHVKDWKSRIRLMTLAFTGSAVYTVFTYFVPQFHNLPILGSHLAKTWVWTLNPSPAYVGQGIIMGHVTALHMLIGCVIGWGLLSPLAKSRGWASGPVDDWETGSKGWIVWVSLAIMLADSLVNIGWLALRTGLAMYSRYGHALPRNVRKGKWRKMLRDTMGTTLAGYTGIDLDDRSGTSTPLYRSRTQSPGDLLAKESEDEAPPDQLITPKVTIIGLIISLLVCIGAVHYSFSGLIPVQLTILALVLAAILSIMACRAIGETDLNPVSGISKMTQLFFALVIPRHAPNAIIINLLAGAISESGTLQAGDLLQDLKTGHILGASPKAQFYGQLIGSAIGAVVSAVVYRLYTNVYKVPGDMFRVPTGYVWVFTARLVTGKGLPPRVAEYALGAGGLWALITAARIYGSAKGAKWVPYLPGGIAVAVGMYNMPSFTLARAAGGVVSWYWCSYRRQSETPVVLLASGLILGEGLLSIVNLCLASASVPHL